MNINVVALSICGASLVLFVGVLVFFLIKLNKIKKAKAEGTEFPKCTKYFWGVMICSIILIVLPVLIPFETYMIAVICASAILAEIIAFRERVQQLSPKSDDKK